MASLANRAPMLVFAAIFLALGLIGWVARATLAQEGKQEPAPAPLPAATPAEPPATLKDARVATSEATRPAPSSEAVDPAPQTHAADIALPGPDRGLSSRVPSEIPPAPAQALAPSGDVGVESTTDDPEKSALAYVEQNQKMAESQLKNLRAEEARLRDRLHKVEAGIKRWESLLGALKQSQGSVAIVGAGSQGNWKQAEPNERGRERLVPPADDSAPSPTSKPIGVKK